MTKKKILIATGIFPPQIGGPAHYVHSLAKEFVKLGFENYVVSFSYVLKLPPIIRHIVYLCKLLVLGWRYDAILGFDLLSVGFPAVLAGKILRKKVILRVGGDFLWEHYVERTKEKIPLSQFYQRTNLYTYKEKIIFNITKFVVRSCDLVVFTTPWFRDIFVSAYGLEYKSTIIIENAFGHLHGDVFPRKQNFLWAGRPLFLKNTEALSRAFACAQDVNPNITLEMYQNLSHEELMEKIKTCYAVIYPSLSEVSPNFVLEALSYGKPSIVTKETGYTNFLRDVALFVDPLDEKDITVKILALAEEKQYQDLLYRARAFGRTHTYAEIAAEYAALFKKII